MDYISDFGIKFAALTLGLAVSNISMANAANGANAAIPQILLQANGAAAQKASVTVNITGLRDEKGHVLICLSSNQKEFPDCAKDASAIKKKVKAANNSKVVFENVDPGVYALALVHDKNSNDKMDLTLFLPKEGFGMSNNPKVRMGKPKFKNSQFTVGAKNVTHNIEMKYIL